MLEKIIIKYGESIFLVLIFIALVPLLKIRTEFNVPYYFAFKNLGTPIVATVFIGFFFFIPEWRRENSFFKGFLMATAIAAVTVLLSGAYVIGYNAWVGEQKPLKITGIVKKLYISGGKRDAYMGIIEESITKEEIKIELNYPQYHELKVGQKFSDDWMVGSLGMKFKVDSLNKDKK